MSNIVNRFSEPVIRARSRVALNHTFYSVLMLNMRTENTNMGGTLWSFGTNGRSIFVNDDEVRTWKIPHLIFGFVHECVHVMTGDMWMAREMGLKPDVANIAQDYWINQQLVDEGFIMPPNGLLDSRFKGWSKLEIYKYLLQNPGHGGGGGGKKKGKGNPMPGDVIPSDEKDEQNLKAEIGIRVKQAAQAAKAIGGHIPQWADDMISDLRKPKVAWQQRLMHLAQIAIQHKRDDYSYRRQNRRYVPQGLIVPTLYNPNAIGWVCMFADTSGSMSEEELQAGYSEAAGIIEQCNPSRFTLADIDTQVRHVREFAPGDAGPTGFTAHGRGGTDFRPAFEWVADPANNFGTIPALVVYFTDMEAYFPTEAPPYPVIWLNTSHHRDDTPSFGEVIDIAPQD